MRLLRIATARLKALVRRDAVAREIREEMQFHLDMRAEEFRSGGLAPDQAARTATRRFGNVALMQDRGYDIRGGGIMETMLQDLRYGLRLLWRDRRFSVVAVGTVALAIGASTALFSVIDSALLRPLPYASPEELVDITFRTQNKAGQWYGAMAPSQNDVRDWRTSGAVFAHLGQARVSTAQVIVDVAGPERVTEGRIAEGFLETFGVAPIVGRGIALDDTRSGAPPVALLGHDYWRARFGADRNVLGRAVRIGGESATIVGVLPAGFHRATSVWRPMAEVPASAANMRGSGTPTYGRLRPGLGLAQAQRELVGLSRRMDESAGRRQSFEVQLRSLYAQTIDEYGATIGVLSGAVAGILLIACINVAGLLLARGASRHPELAIRASVGAGRTRLVRQLLTESLVLALAGGLGGVLLAWLLLDGLVAILPLSLPPNAPPSINLMVLAFGASLSALIALLFGLVPAVRLSGVQVGLQLARAGRRQGSALSRRGGQLLIAAEVALALVLLTGAGLMVRSFSRALAVDVGFDPAAFVTMEVFPVDPDPAVRDRYFPALLDTIRSIPGVAAAGAIDYAPLGRGAMYTSVRAQGEFVSAAVKVVTPGYFEAIGLTPLQGRLPAGTVDPAAILSASAARRLFPDGSPVGHWITTRLKTGGQVVGVVRDIRSRDAFLSDDDPDVYLVAGPSQTPPSRDSLTVVVRPAGRVTGLNENLRRAAHAVGPPVIVERIRSGSDWFSDNVETPRHRTLLLGLLGGLGLTLTLVGIFGVTAYAVARRTREIGIRMAFGARPLDVVVRMVRDAAWPMVAGLCAGLAGAYYATRAVESFLFETTPHDPVTFVSVAVLMVLAGLLAAWLPARRAARIDPVVALRAE